MRGEYLTHWHILTFRLELPPRARRILRALGLGLGATGTTSACAENTARACLGSWVRWNYLRVRGEYASPKSLTVVAVELPPRARRIPYSIETDRAGWGTTSACAENTPQLIPGPYQSRNYLRVRGEYRANGTPARVTVELPPRARRIRVAIQNAYKTPGTTSACAENTAQIHHQGTKVWNYLRVRGEYPYIYGKKRLTRELPPRARRIPEVAADPRSLVGTTSACAENTSAFGSDC